MTMGSFVTGNMDYIRRPFVANIKPGHRVLILSDFSHDPRVWQIVQSVCAELGAETTVALFERRPADYYDPPSAVCEAMMKSDFNVCCSPPLACCIATQASPRWRLAFRRSAWMAACNSNGSSPAL